MSAIGWRKSGLVVALAAVFILSIGLPVIANAMTANTHGAATVASLTTATSQTPQAVAPAASHEGSPHNGTLDVYETVPGGATTEDPAMAYDTSSYEPILNVYGTLVEYNGTSTSSWVPDLATCVPGTPQCATDYGAGFTGEYDATGHNDSTPATDPVQYYTFVIDPAAKFYDPTTHASWGVYPSDVMFSFARTMMFSEQPSIAKTAGWIDTQALLPYTTESGAWDNGTHPAWNNTPYNVYSSMYINDSAFCPATAIGPKGHGCITFNADGQGSLWPEFMEFATDPAGSAIVSCGFYTYKGAGIPGWTGTTARHGDGSCKLPDGGTATNNSAWDTFLNGTLAGAYPYKWDTVELSNVNWPNTFPNVRWNMVGTGPYYAKITPSVDYALAADPAYAQPSGCSGANGLAKYTDSYCNPAPGKFIPNVKVIWETSEEGDSLGIDAILAGTADFAGIEPAHTTTLKSFVASGIWKFLDFPTTADAFIPLALAINWDNYNSSFSPYSEPNPIPQTFTTDVALRNFLTHSYPYQTVDNTINTVDGLQFVNGNYGGPIPYNVSGDYAGGLNGTATNFPYLECGSSICNDTNVGVPSNNSSVVGNAAWWWNQLTNATLDGPYYNATIATKCTHGNPCTFPMGWFNGNTVLETEVDDWAALAFNISNGAIEMIQTPISFSQYLETLGAAYTNPLIGATGFGWIMDYPDPSDWFVPISLSDGGYTAAQALGEQLDFGVANAANNSTCGHSGISWTNLTYWAGAANNLTGAMTDACQTVAYSVAANYLEIGDALAQSPTRQADMVLAQEILNGLSIDVWQGQSNAIIGYAPWINGASINENPTIGAGGIGLFYQLQYVTGLTKVTIKESGLPTNTTWGITVDGNSLTNTTYTKGHAAVGSVVYYASGSGTLTLAPNATTSNTSYLPVKITGPGTTTYTSAAVTAGTPLTLVEHFGAKTTITYTEAAPSHAFPGLGSDAWSVDLTPSTKGSNTAATVTLDITGNGSANFSGPRGLAYTYTITSPGGFTSSPTHGSVAFGAHNLTKTVKFKPSAGSALIGASALAVPASLAMEMSVGDAHLAAVPVRGGA